MLNFLKRNYYHTSKTTKEKLYSSLVRPHLDYTSAAWDPYTDKNINDLEKVQNAAARFVTNTYGKDTSVSALKNNLGWPLLQERRRKNRISCYYKILNNHLDIDQTKYISPKTERTRRGHNNQFQIQRTRTDVYANSFFIRTTKDWNKLPPSLISINKASDFKTALDDFSTINQTPRLQI